MKNAIASALRSCRDESEERDGLSEAEYDNLVNPTRVCREARALGWDGKENLKEFHARRRAERIAADPQAAAVNARWAAAFAK